ncbi:hypothetical protein [Pseudorhodoferax sp.]|uniref:hypothetical protein n=1 Tax=Pseudorhodoferax sp. TaxID=1993553 RepID=UPI002DD62C98|nr:hypothetical protein [Pseudorhodoferax sp.]
MSASPITHPRPAPDTQQAFQPATVLQLHADGLVTVQAAGHAHSAAVATHVPGLVVGQAVLLAAACPSMGNTDPLVIAAWPCPGAPIAPPWQFDRASGTLTLSAPHLTLDGIGSVLLRCADACMQFTRDGAVQTRGHSITSAAVETHRIEGGSIELN